MRLTYYSMCHCITEPGKIFRDSTQIILYICKYTCADAFTNCKAKYEYNIVAESAS